MRRAVAILLVAALAAALPSAAADARRGKPRKRLHAKVHKARAKAPARWKRIAFAGPAARPAPDPASGAPAPAGTPAPTAAPAPDGPPPPPPLPDADPRSVSVGSTEWALTLSQPSVLSGSVRMQFDNSRAEDPHDLVVISPGGETWSFGELAAGEVTARTLPLDAVGTYELLCPLPEHEARGMSAQLTVRGG